MIKQIKLDSFYLIDKLEEHNKVKKNLVNLINKSDAGSLTAYKQFKDNIHNVDWNQATNFNRDWVKILKPYLQKQFDNYGKFMGFEKSIIKELWFQKYKKTGKHGWHIHGGTFTGVYYLQFTNKCAKTELIDPLSKKVITINAKEGDVVLFPSYIIHQAKEQKNSKEKIIVSFNIEYVDVLTK